MPSSHPGSPINLQIHLDRDAEVPLGVQLAWDLRSRITSGELRAGQRLPGLRELSEMAGVNANTVRAVYHRLEQEDLVATHQGSGTFVAAAPPRRDSLMEVTARAALAAREEDLDPREVAAALYMGLEGAGAQKAATAQRRRLRDQIATLEQTLAQLEARHPNLAPTLDERPAKPRPRILTIGELEAQREQLLLRLTGAQAALSEPDGGTPPPRSETADVAAPKRSRRPSRPRPMRAATAEA